MGLDNIPAVYPRVKQGSAIFTDDERGVIDCDATQAAGGCPWAIAQERDRGTPVTGMMGTDCWYRGKVGTRMLGILEHVNYRPPVEGGFYGPDETNLSPEYCEVLGRWMAEHVEAYAAALRSTGQADNIEADINEYRYAAWWLTWIAEAGDGAKAWW